MNIKQRSYNNEDYVLIAGFLAEHYKTDNQEGNWLKPAWEFIHNHVCIDMFQLDKAGVWEDNGEVVGIVHLNSPYLGNINISLNPKYLFLQADMLEYAENKLYGVAKDGRAYLRTFIRDTDKDYENTAKSMGYVKNECNSTVLLKYKIDSPFPEIKIPNSFQINSLADEYDFEKINKGLWRAFEYPGEPPVDKNRCLPKLHAWTNYNRDITVMIQDSDGNLASFCGMWYDNVTKVAYVEPVATNPEYRHMGLGKAAVLEAIKRCGILGATDVYVEPDIEEFYTAIGFRRLYKSFSWSKFLYK